MRFPFSRQLKSYIIGRRCASIMSLAGWRFTPFRAKSFFDEVSSWQEKYLPFDLTGKVVLDIGAGEGETAKFFLHYGAVKVVCVECDDWSFYNLLINSKRFKGIVPYHTMFTLSFMDLPVDFCKIDIEGYEELLLDAAVKPKFPCVVEVHGLQLRERFQAQGWRVSVMENSFTCTSYAYWKC